MGQIERPLGGIHTVQYKSEKEPNTLNVMGYDGVTSNKAPSHSCGKYYFQLNAESCVDWCGRENMKGFKENFQSYTFEEQRKALRKALYALNCEKAELMRLDFKFDWKETPYREMTRMNDLLVECLIASQGIDREAGSLDGTPHGRGPEKTKLFYAKSKKFEVEYYDKTVQARRTAFEKGVSARLEIRKKQIQGGAFILSLIWLKEALEKVPLYVETAEKNREEYLCERWNDGKYTMRRFSQFFEGTKHLFFSVHHLESFLEKVGCKNPKKFALEKQGELRKKGDAPLLIKKEFERYVDMLVDVMESYLHGEAREVETHIEVKGFTY